MDEEALPVLHVKDGPGAVERYGRLGLTRQVKGCAVAVLLFPVLLVSGCLGRST
ncbi:hypothetical protein ABT330_28460 [Streptomyces sp. NPDC000658]|uniref:hypothetical protein n=1 Tax=Streptomyces sp. NPDC000658 TaxID=3154266 RepID=UPI0033292380